MDRCLTIKQLLANGHGLEEIKTLLDRAPGGSRSTKRRYRFVEVSKLLDYQQAVIDFRETVWRKFPDVVSKGRKRVPGNLRAADEQLSTPRIVDQVIDLLQQEMNILLTFDGEKVDVCPDFLIPQRLAQAGSGGKALIVVPVFEEALAAFSAVLDNLPKTPKFIPVPRVREQGGKRKEFACHLRADGGFRLVDSQ